MADGAEGANYEDLWRLANIIGPARPVTTTQEAIDNAGFPVGTFEQEVQGMRNITTLGDGTKCLVCMSEYEEGENLRALKCKHGFHQECIDKVNDRDSISLSFLSKLKRWYEITHHMNHIPFVWFIVAHNWGEQMSNLPRCSCCDRIRVANRGDRRRRPSCVA